MGKLIAQQWHGNTNALRARDRRSGTFYAYIPHPVATWQPLLPADIAAFIAEAEHELRATASSLNISGSEDGMFFWAESLGSSRIEGVMPSTRNVVHALIRKQKWPDRKFHEPVFEVIGNIEATDSALAMLANRPHLTLQSLLDAHRILMDASPTAHLGGVVRADQNWVGGNDWHPLEGDFAPPPPDHCAALLDDLVSYIHSEEHSPLLQAAIAHAQFETIHPFGDGNGRTGRAVLYAILKQRCAPDATMPPVSLALSRNKDAYLDSLTQFQSYLGEAGDPQRSEAMAPWLEVLASAVHQSCAAVRNYQAAMESLQQRWRSVVGGRRSRSIVAETINLLPLHPSLSAKALSKLTEGSESRCAAALRKLEALGIVTGRRADAGLRVYDADKVFDAYEVMASTICDAGTSPADYADILAEPFIVADKSHPLGEAPTTAGSWKQCPRSVKSTRKPCSLAKGHRGACRHLAHRKHPPRS